MIKKIELVVAKKIVYVSLMTKLKRGAQIRYEELFATTKWVQSKRPNTVHYIADITFL
jgi:hypothetical protein